MLAGIVSACQYSPDTVQRTIAYNGNIADSGNQVLLLNIVRASQRLPTYYSRLEGNTAASTFNPQVNIAIPLGLQKQTTSNVLGSVPADVLNANPAGAAASGILNSLQLTRNLVTLTPQLSATETNTLTLQSLDDQQYILGMMTPASSGVYANFLNYGWTPELLAMVFVQQIQFGGDGDPPGPKMDDLLKQTTTACSGTSVKDTRILCQRLGLLAASDTSAGIPISACLNPTTAKDTEGIFVSDPALADTVDMPAPDMPTYDCFLPVLQAMLVLGLTPAQPPGTAVAILKRLPADTVIGNDFISGLLTKGLILAKTDKEFVICSIGASGPSGSPASGGSGSGGGSSGSGGSGSGGGASSPPDLGFVLPQYGQPPKSSAAANDREAQCRVAAQAEPNAPGGAGKVSAVESGKWTDLASISLRSPESIVYFLGQITRRETALPASGPGQKGPRRANGEILFDVLKGAAPASSPMRASFNGDTYYIPDFCDRQETAAAAKGDAPVAAAPTKSIGCNAEHPEHRTLDVMTLLNQLWGLQKQATSFPLPAPVTIVNP